jgi:hypothetical protein
MEKTYLPTRSPASGIWFIIKNAILKLKPRKQRTVKVKKVKAAKLIIPAA